MCLCFGVNCPFKRRRESLVMSVHTISSKGVAEETQAQLSAAEIRRESHIFSILLALSCISAPSADKGADHECLKGNIMAVASRTCTSSRAQNQLKADSFIKSVCVWVCVWQESKHHKGDDSRWVRFWKQNKEGNSWAKPFHLFRNVATSYPWAATEKNTSVSNKS